MFDTYRPVFQSGPSHVSVSTIEKRAPTDESVRLLMEMEAAAAAKVLSAVRVENTAFQGVLHHMEDHLTGIRKFRCVFKLNGKQMTASYECDREDFTREVAAVGIRDAIAREVANAITSSVFSAIRF